MEPSKETDTYGRNDFSIHGGVAFGSAGCIDLRTEISDFIKLISSKISIIDIDIDNGNIDELIVRLYEEYKI